MDELFRYKYDANEVGSENHRIKVAKTKGTLVFGQNGKKYLDFRAGWCVGNSGWNNPTIMKAIKKFTGPVFVTQSDEYEPWNVLAKKLVDLMPNKNYTCFRATGGTEAVEIALKIAKAHNSRKKFIAFKDAYHGQSFSEMALVGLHEKKFGPYGDNYIRLNTDWDEATKKAVQEIEKGDVCAFISEPIICNLAVVVPPLDFMQKVRDACSRTGTVFIMDEIMSGFGRTGKWFGFEHYNLEPDIVTIAKGFSSGHAAIGSAIAKSEIAKGMDFNFSNYSTFGWHPISTAAAIANVEYIQNKGLVEKSKKSGKYLLEKLSEFNAQGKGLCIGLDCSQGDCAKLLENGLIVGDFGNRVCLYPNLEVSEKEINKAAGIITKVLGA